MLTIETLATYLREAESVHLSRGMPACDWPTFYGAFLKQRIEGAGFEYAAEYAIFATAPAGITH